VKTPLIWRQIASNLGEINSNYGYLFLSKENGSQLDSVVDHLIQDPGSRRAAAVYTNPFIHKQWNRDGMSDFICTNAVQYLIREGKLEVVVQMRSNDAIFGYRNDYAWQKYAQNLVLDKLASNGLVYESGNIIWNAASLHIYKRHFELISNYSDSGDYLTEVS
jgi:thymidylate synthase